MVIALHEPGKWETGGGGLNIPNIKILYFIIYEPFSAHWATTTNNFMLILCCDKLENNNNNHRDTRLASSPIPHCSFHSKATQYRASQPVNSTRLPVLVADKTIITNFPCTHTHTHLIETVYCDKILFLLSTLQFISSTSSFHPWQHSSIAWMFRRRTSSSCWNPHMSHKSSLVVEIISTLAHCSQPAAGTGPFILEKLHFSTFFLLLLHRILCDDAVGLFPRVPKADAALLLLVLYIKSDTHFMSWDVGNNF